MTRRPRLAAHGALIVCSILGAACGSAAAPPRTPPDAERPAVDAPIAPGPAAAFAEALKAMAAHDARGDWSPKACAAVATRFVAAAEAQARAGGTFAEARYDAGLAHRRCDDHRAAREQFARALADEPRAHGARMQLALYALDDAGDAGLDAAIVEIQRAVIDSRFSNVEALVNLATLQMRRRSPVASPEGERDIDRAKANLQRALAADDTFLPAYDRLAIWYLESARHAEAGRGSGSGRLVAGPDATRRPKTRDQALELAALVCSQAIRRDPTFSPIHNTAGLVHLELGDLARAVSEFNTARRLDPTAFEAHMNAAAVNLSFRGFRPAEDAYRAAIRLRPDDYEAHLGLALALRGQIDPADPARRVDLVQAELDRAKALAPGRAETYYNEAILREEFKAKQGGPTARAELTRAKALHLEFLAKAGSAPEYADAAGRARERIVDIDRVLGFIP